MPVVRVRWLVLFCLIGLAVYSYKLTLFGGTSDGRATRKEGHLSGDGKPSGEEGGGGGAEPAGQTKETGKAMVPADGGIAGYQKVFAPDEYEKHLVIPRMTKEDISWVRRLPSDLNIVLKNYVMDAKGKGGRAPPGALTVPMNKGREAMAYLTYIIDHYDTLPDIAIFAHAHQQAWHNNDLQGSSTLVMLMELNYRRVIRKGYMNLRCHWKPGCPDWILLNATASDEFKERYAIRETLMRMFPQEMELHGIPEVIGVACCAQFAVSKERILVHPREHYVAWREWVIDTSLHDDLSGRVMEYLWHYMFAPPSPASTQEKMISCPLENVCYCDGYGYCFGSAEKFDNWRKKVAKSQELTERLKLAEDGVGKKPGEDENWRREGMEKLRRDIQKMVEESTADAQEARKRGLDPVARKQEVGDEFSG